MPRKDVLSGSGITTKFSSEMALGQNVLSRNDIMSAIAQMFPPGMLSRENFTNGIIAPKAMVEMFYPRILLLCHPNFLFTNGIKAPKVMVQMSFSRILLRHHPNVPAYILLRRHPNVLFRNIVETKPRVTSRPNHSPPPSPEKDYCNYDSARPLTVC